MKPHRLFALCILPVLVCGVIMFSGPGSSLAVFYQKHYVVERDRDKDILCDPYVVQKDDSVVRLLEQRGDIAHKDFPKFLDIFKRINPRVRDMDLIYPDQQILIPLRILEPGTLTGQETGQVTIPVIPITGLSENLKQFADPYTVEYGDWISRLISERFGRYGSDGYKRGMRLFKMMNPEIKNPDKVRAGSRIRLPDPEIKKEPWYADVMEQARPAAVQESSDKNNAVESGRAANIGGDTIEESQNNAKNGRPSVSVQWFADLSVLAKAAEILDVRIFDKGRYYFPRSGEKDLSLDLSKTPVVEISDGRKFLLTRRQWISPGDQAVLQVYWRNLEVLFVPRQPALTWLLEKLIPKLDPGGYQNRMEIDDKGLNTVLRGQFIYQPPENRNTIYLNILSDPEMKTPESVCAYLESRAITVRDWVETPEKSGWIVHDTELSNARRPEPPGVQTRRPERLVRFLVEKLGYTYHENVEVCFPYAGFQVRATANLLSLGKNAEMLIDYGDLQGDAVDAIEKTGFRVLQIPPGSEPDAILEQLGNILNLEIMPDPIFWTVNRPRIHNISLQVPGVLVSSRNRGGGKQILLSDVPVAREFLRYFDQQDISVIRRH